jgi:hypothetical protein
MPSNCEKQQYLAIASSVNDAFNFLKSLAKTRSIHKRKRLLKRASKDELLAICEICLNIVKRHFSLTTRQKKRMLPYADFVRQMGRVRSEKGARRIVQKGNGMPLGLFPAILTPIIIEIARFLVTHSTTSLPPPTSLPEK